ncbi:rod shape-determining protein MreD [Tepidibacillus sp. LV47]|uniref:rod shape-determining protein MreD n=1 Tax=Tepidibacillus sp. LV47 TaxID=3398228 RepID=UPI003AAECA91
MHKFWTYSILFLLFVFEGTIFQFLSVDFFYSLVTIVPHFVLVMIVYISIFQDKKKGLIMGLIFGLLYDIVYGKMIGINLMGMALIGYFSGWLTQYFQRSFPLYVLIETLAVFLFELYSYGILRLFHVIDISLEWALMQVMIPTVIVNGMIAILFFRPFQLLIIERKADDDR